MGEVKLEDVCEFFRGLTYSKKNETTFSDKIVLRASNIDLDTSTLVLHDLKYLKENFVIPDDKKLQKDCIFICMSSGSKSHLGKVAYIARDYDYAFGGFMGLIKPKTNILPRYLFYLLQTPEYKELIKKLSNGININNIKFSDLKEFQFELPSLEEQEKILNILDKADEIRTKKKQANEKLDEFLKSTFVDMFGDPVKNEKHFPLVKFSDMGTLARGKSKHRPRNAPELLGGQYPLIQTGDIANAGLYLRKYNQTYSELGLKQSKMWRMGTLCITIAANIAKTSIMTFDACFPDSIVGFNNNEKSNIQYIQFWLMFLQAVLEAEAPQSAQKNINLEILNGLSLPYPPIEEQNKFAQIVEKVEEQKQRNEKIIEQMDNLFNSLSQRAFKGEL